MIDQKAREIAIDAVGYDETTYRFSDVMGAARLGIIEGRRQAFEEAAKVADSRALREGRYEKAGRVADEIATAIRALMEEP